MRRALLALVLLAAGCGGSEEAVSPGAETSTRATTTGPAPTTPAPPPAEPVPAGRTALSVYFLRDGRIAAARRTVPETAAVARAALEELAAGPTPAEREAGLTSDVPPGLQIDRLSVAGGVATVDLAVGCPPVAQIVYTLTQFPTVERVRGNCLPGAGLARADLEDATPAILVESPTVGESISSPLRIRGTANTYEANFIVNVTDWDGRIVARNYVTATSGSGERGTFDVTIPFEVGRPGGALIVFEESAEDGSQQNVVEIPLDLQPG